MSEKEEILDAINGVKADLTKAIDTNQKKFEKTMFGEDGTGGVMRQVIDVSGIVCGVKDVPDDRGLLGAVKDIEDCVSGKNGLKTKVERLETKQSIWNLSLTGGHVVTWVKMLLGLGS